MKNAVFWDVTPCGIMRRLLVTDDVLQWQKRQAVTFVVIPEFIRNGTLRQTPHTSTVPTVPLVLPPILNTKQQKLGPRNCL
jgi:hypothetical protein